MRPTVAYATLTLATTRLLDVINVPGRSPADPDSARGDEAVVNIGYTHCRPGRGDIGG